MREYTIEDAKFQKWVYPNGSWRMEWVVALDNGLFRHDVSRAALARSLTQRNREISKAYAPVAAVTSLREEVIEAMVAMGIARPVAAERTKNPNTLKALAIEFEVL